MLDSIANQSQNNACFKCTEKKNETIEEENHAIDNEKSKCLVDYTSANADKESINQNNFLWVIKEKMWACTKCQTQSGFSSPSQNSDLNEKECTCPDKNNIIGFDQCCREVALNAGLKSSSLTFSEHEGLDKIYRQCLLTNYKSISDGRAPNPIYGLDGRYYPGMFIRKEFMVDMSAFDDKNKGLVCSKRFMKQMQNPIKGLSNEKIVSEMIQKNKEKYLTSQSLINNKIDSSKECILDSHYIKSKSSKSNIKCDNNIENQNPMCSLYTRFCEDKKERTSCHPCVECRLRNKLFKEKTESQSHSRCRIHCHKAGPCRPSSAECCGGCKCGHTKIHLVLKHQYPNNFRANKPQNPQKEYIDKGTQFKSKSHKSENKQFHFTHHTSNKIPDEQMPGLSTIDYSPANTTKDLSTPTPTAGRSILIRDVSGPDEDPDKSEEIAREKAAYLDKYCQTELKGDDSEVASSSVNNPNKYKLVINDQTRENNKQPNLRETLNSIKDSSKKMCCKPSRYYSEIGAVSQSIKKGIQKITTPKTESSKQSSDSYSSLSAISSIQSQGSSKNKSQTKSFERKVTSKRLPSQKSSQISPQRKSNENKRPSRQRSYFTKTDQSDSSSISKKEIRSSRNNLQRNYVNRKNRTKSPSYSSRVGESSSKKFDKERSKRNTRVYNRNCSSSEKSYKENSKKCDNKISAQADVFTNDMCSLTDDSSLESCERFLEKVISHNKKNDLDSLEGRLEENTDDLNSEEVMIVELPCRCFILNDEKCENCLSKDSVLYRSSHGLLNVSNNLSIGSTKECNIKAKMEKINEEDENCKSHSRSHNTAGIACETPRLVDMLNEVLCGTQINIPYEINGKNCKNSEKYKVQMVENNSNKKLACCDYTETSLKNDHLITNSGRIFDPMFIKSYRNKHTTQNEDIDLLLMSDSENDLVYAAGDGNDKVSSKELMKTKEDDFMNFISEFESELPLLCLDNNSHDGNSDTEEFSKFLFSDKNEKLFDNIDAFETEEWLEFRIKT